jgi:hypothetical protein
MIPDVKPSTPLRMCRGKSSLRPPHGRGSVTKPSRARQQAVGRFLTFLYLWAPAQLLASGGSAEPIVFVADSRRYTGWEAWFTNLYNESLSSFTLLTVVSIPVIGVILGTIADLLMKQVGINLRSRSVGEH